LSQSVTDAPIKGRFAIHSGAATSCRRRQDDDEDEQGHRSRRPVAPDPFANRDEQRPRGDGEHDRPGERRQEGREHPHRERQQAERCGDARAAPGAGRAVRHRNFRRPHLGHSWDCSAIHFKIR